MAEVGGEFGVAGGFTGAEKGGGDGAVLGGGEEPVAGEADDEGRSCDGGEGGLEGGGAGGEVEGVESAGDIEVAVGVEAVDEAAALVAQVALDLETHVEGVEAGGGVFGDLAAAKFTVHAGVAEVGDVGHHAGDGEAHARAGAGGVVAALPARVLEDGLASDFVEGDGLGAFAAGGGEGDEALDEAGEEHAELEDLHAAHGAADGGAQAGDTERGEPAVLGAHHVGDGYRRKRNAVGAAGGGTERGRAGGALATTEDVGAEDKPEVGIDGFARADEVVPPTGLTVVEAVEAGAVVVAAEGVADEDGVVAGGVEAAVGFVAEGETGEDAAVVAAEGLGGPVVARGHEADFARFGGGGGGRILGGVVNGWEGT